MELRRTVRPGFTIIEMIVVVLLILVLMGFLLPMLTQARMGGSRAECASQMRQIGLAIANYDLRFHGLPTGNQNVVYQLAPLLERPDAQGGVSNLFRCPSDSFISADRLRLSLSYAPAENDVDPAAQLYCPWSLAFGGRPMMRSIDTVSPSTVLLLESWNPANRANAQSIDPGWVRPTLNWTGGPAPLVLPAAPGMNVGGYLFLRAWQQQATGTGSPVPLEATFHNGAINLLRADGGCEGRIVKEITRTSPKDYGIWTRGND